MAGLGKAQQSNEGALIADRKAARCFKMTSAKQVKYSKDQLPAVNSSVLKGWLG